MIKKILLLFLCITTLSLGKSSRVVVLDPAAVEIIYMLGAEKNIVGIASSQMTPINPIEKTKYLTSVGNIQNPSLEKIISLKPDHVIMGFYADDIIASLKKYKIPYTVLSVNSINDMFENITKIGNILGKEMEAKKLIKSSNEKLNNIKINLKKKPLNLKGTFIYNPQPLMVFGKNSITNEVLNILGVKDISENLTGKQPILSNEYTLIQNPDFLIGIMGVKNKENLLKSNSFLANTKAGKNQNIYILKTNKLLRLSPYMIDEIVEIYNFLDKIN